MSLIVKTITRVTVGSIFVFGGYIAVQSPLALGGGLAGGVIIALAYIAYILAYGATEAEERLEKGRATMIMGVGALLFLLLALLGFAGGKLMNLAIMLLVGAGLFVVFLTLVTIRVSAKEGAE